MKQVTIAPRGVAIALAALTLFALGGVALGAMLATGADRVAAVTHGNAGDYRIGGGVLVALGALVLLWAVRRWFAVRAFEIGDAWIAIDYLGRRTELPAGDVVLELYGRRVVWTFGAAPRIQDVVDGRVRAGGVSKRLAPSGPTTYDAVLRSLGFDGTAPRRGRARYERSRPA
jgi:hypothetical protein